MAGTDALPMVTTNIIGRVGSLEARNTICGAYVIGPIQQWHNEESNNDDDDHGEDEDTDEQPTSDGRIINIWM